MFTRKFDRRVYVAVGVFLFSGAVAASFGPYVLWPSNREAGYAPEQPIPFSHAVHAGTLKIDCMYCHTGAETGAQATVPPLSTCMNCHEEVQPVDSRGELKPGIVTLLDHWESRRPLLWNKVSDLADFAYFDHSRHISAGISCQECHGPVEKMDRVRREWGMKMSWCLNCHMQTPPPDSAAAVRGDAMRAPIHCTTCHR